MGDMHSGDANSSHDEDGTATAAFYKRAVNGLPFHAQTTQVRRGSSVLGTEADGSADGALFAHPPPKDAFNSADYGSRDGVIQAATSPTAPARPRTELGGG